MRTPSDVVNLAVNENALALRLCAYDIEAGRGEAYPYKGLSPGYDFAVELDRVDRRAHTMSFQPAGFASGVHTLLSRRDS